MNEPVTVKLTKSSYYSVPKIGDIFGGCIIIRKNGNELVCRSLSSIKLFRWIEIKWYIFKIKKGWIK